MNHDKVDIERSIAHQHQMLRALRDRLQQREIQEAQQGISVDPAVRNEIHHLTERIHRHEEELARLQTVEAEDKEPLTHVEYRMLVAEAWDTPEGRPTVAAAARLEYHRLHLKVKPSRAQEIEHEVRTALVKESFRHIKRRFYRNDTFELSIPWHTKRHLFPEAIHSILDWNELDQLKIIATVEYPLLHDKDEKSLSLIVKCIMLDHTMALEMFTKNFSTEPIVIGNVRFNFLFPNDAGISTKPPEEFSDPAFWLDVLFRIFKRNLTRATGASGIDTDVPIARFVSELQSIVTSR